MAVSNAIPETLAAMTGPGQQLATKWATDNGAWLKKIIDDHKTWLETAEVKKYQEAYDGYLETVDLREKSRGDGINNKLMPNYAALIIDTAVDYLAGKPLTWTFEIADKEEAKKLEATLEDYKAALLKLIRGEEAQRVLTEQLRQGGIAGYSAVIHWVDEKGRIDYDEFPVNEVIPVYDVRGRLQLVIRYYAYKVLLDNGETAARTRVEVYDDRYVTYYLSTEDGDGYELDSEEAETGNPVEHRAGRIPVSVYVNGTPARYENRQKKNGISDLATGVYTLLENLAHTTSDKANTVERLLDQYLKLKGVDVDEKEVTAMHKARAIALKSKESDADFIAPKQEDQAVENHLKRLIELIHDTTCTPRLNDLSGATATEIKMKFAPLDVKANKKELHFNAAIKQTVAILTDMLNYKRLVEAGQDSDEIHAILAGEEAPPTSMTLYNAEWVSWTINRNLPQNYKEIADIVKILVGVVPDYYLLELLWFIDDPEAALEELKKQRAEEDKREANKAKAAMGLDQLDNTDDGTGGTGE